MQNTPAPWDQGSRARASSNEMGPRPSNRESSHRDSRESRERIERLGVGSRHQQQQGHHSRNDSGNTGIASSADFAETHSQAVGRRHDYDVQSMETDLSSPRHTHAKNPIPAPIVTVRSEFPTLNRSRQQQSLTCLVTIEVPEGKWNPDPEDLRNVPPVPPLPQDDAASMRPSVRKRHVPSDPVYEAPEILEQVTEELKNRVDNWHGLEFQR